MFSKLPSVLPPELRSYVSASTAHLFAVAPLEVRGELLTVAGVQPLEEELIEALAEITRCAIRQETTTEVELLAALDRYFPAGQLAPVAVVDRHGQPCGGASIQGTAPAPVLRLCRRLMILATDPDLASLALLPDARGAVLRGVSHMGERTEQRLLTSYLAQQAVRQMKAFAGLDPDLPPPQGGALEVTGMAHDLRLVVETYFHAGFECVRVSGLD